MGDRIQDVLVFPTGHEEDNQDHAFPIGDRVDIGDDLWIGRLKPYKLWKCVLGACEQRGYKYRPSRLWGQMYTFVRELPPGENPLLWDPDQRLQLSVALSRLVHPTSVSLEYAARLFFGEEGTLKRIVPAQVTGGGSAAYVVPGERDWLTPEDADELKSLLAAYDEQPLEGRCARALWYLEFAARTCEVDVRWVLVATGIESLIHTDRQRSTKQFVVRLQKLAAAVGAGGVSKQEAEDMYELRSSLAHGGGLATLDDSRLALYTKMEGILRGVVKKAILDENFRAFLDDPQALRSRWPV